MKIFQPKRENLRTHNISYLLSSKENLPKNWKNHKHNYDLCKEFRQGENLTNF